MRVCISAPMIFKPIQSRRVVLECSSTKTLNSTQRGMPMGSKGTTLAQHCSIIGALNNSLSAHPSSNNSEEKVKWAMLLLKKGETIHLNPIPPTIQGPILVCWQDMEWIRGKIRSIYEPQERISRGGQLWERGNPRHYTFS